VNTIYAIAERDAIDAQYAKAFSIKEPVFYVYGDSRAYVFEVPKAIWKEAAK
jgi:hypothetical protein